MEESMNTSESNENVSTDVEPQDVGRHGNDDQVSQISQLLRRGLSDDVDDGDDIDDEHDDSDTNEHHADEHRRDRPTDSKPPKTLAELSEQTKIPVEELYKLAIPDGHEEGKTRTLGELKDLATRSHELEIREVQIEEKRTTREAALNRMEQELSDLIGLVPEKMRDPKLIQQISERHESKIRTERKRTLDKIPEWKDDTTRQTEIAGILEHLQDYGLPKSYFGTIADHRLINYIRENWKRHDRIKRTLEQINEKFPQTPRGSGQHKRGTTKASDKGPSRKVESQVRQVSQLLRHGANE